MTGFGVVGGNEGKEQVRMKRGASVKSNLIIVEGIPGSGKSTTAHFMKEHLEKEGVKVNGFGFGVQNVK